MSIYHRVPPFPDLLNALMDFEIQLERYHRRLGPLIRRGCETGENRPDVARAVELIYYNKYMCTRLVMDLCCTQFLSEYFYTIAVKMDRLENLMKLIFREPIPSVYRFFL